MGGQADSEERTAGGRASATREKHARTDNTQLQVSLNKNLLTDFYFRQVGRVKHPNNAAQKEQLGCRIQYLQKHLSKRVSGVPYKCVQTPQS